MEQHNKSIIDIASNKATNLSSGNLIKKHFALNSHSKIIWLFFVLLISLPMVLAAQSHIAQKSVNNRISDQQTIKLLCHQWYIENNRLAVPMGYFPVDSISTIDFFTNGYAKFKSDRTLDAVWNYDFSRHIIFIILQGKLSKYRVINITGSSLILENMNGKKATKISLFRTI